MSARWWSLTVCLVVVLFFTGVPSVVTAAATADPPPPAAKVVSLKLSSGRWLTYEPAPGASADDEGRPSKILVRIYKNNKQAQEIPVEISDRIMSDADVVTADYNLDGKLDFSCPDTAGNVMIFRSVYLYNPKSDSFELSEAFSQLPCIEVNPATKRVGGYCFHNSAVENWIEEYTVHGWDALELVHQKGTMPSLVPIQPKDAAPSGDVEYTYEDAFLVYDTVYKNGRVVSHKEEKVPFDKDK